MLFSGKPFAIFSIAMVCVRLIILYLYLCVTLTVQAAAEDFLVSADHSGAEQNNPSVAVGHDGKFAVAWIDFRNGNSDLYAQLFDSVAVGYNFIINDDSIGAWQLDPDLSADWYGNYYLVWKDYRNNSFPFDPDIYFQKLDSLGKVGENKNITVEQPDSSHYAPSVASAGWGKSVVAWKDVRNNNWDIFCQTVDSSATLIGSNTRVNDDLTFTPQHEPDIALSAKGWFVVVWYDGRNGNDDVYIQKFDSTGQAVGTNIKINDDGDDSKQKFPSVVIGGNDVITVVWTDWRRGNYPVNPDIFGQRYSSDMARLGSNFVINKDNTHTTQRDPRVAADRRGNVCVVWSDSSQGNWNARGQIIEFDGSMTDENFAVNLDSAGVQYIPDVAMDGEILYFVWADNREGNFDIYGRTYQYYEPSLLVSPSNLEFSKDKYAPSPEPQVMNLQSAGDSEVNYALVAESDWIELSKSTGTTPDSFSVSITSDTLDYGVHLGYIRLVDIAHNDSALLAPVLLNITGPLLEFDSDTLAFRALKEVGSPDDQSFIIENSGTGSLNWSITESDTWLSVDITSGTAGDSVTVSCDISSLTAGNYTGYVIVSDDEALNSPESLVVTLAILENLAYLTAEPDTLSLDIIWGKTITDSFQIVNLGGAASNWTAESETGWLEITTAAGSDSDYVCFSIATDTLDTVLYVGSMVIHEAAAFNDSITVTLSANIYISDTIFIPPVSTQLDQEFDVSVYLHIQNSINRGKIQLRYDSLMVICDSIADPSGDLNGRTTATVETDPDRLTIEILADTLLGAISPGQYHLGDLKMRANDSLVGTTALTVNVEDSLFLETEVGFVFSPIPENHDITIDYPTSVDDRETNHNPAIYSLDQNYPNPFNGRTEINFYMPRGDAVRLEIFNILGQRVAVVVDAYLPAGSHQVVWDAKTSDGAVVASGLYFYKFSSTGFSDVRKMIYLK
ncbi:MAG: T9SS type A sorting domain-containing protein [FCB group bacterium]|nr:T9SS type A sorting domain-containing protein [FCB group bacterium]